MIESYAYAHAACTFNMEEQDKLLKRFSVAAHSCVYAFEKSLCDGSILRVICIYQAAG
jgi:hypothetical protein